MTQRKYGLEGQVEPEGGDGGLEGPPLGKQHDLLSHQNSDLLQEGFEGPFGEVGGGAGCALLANVLSAVPGVSTRA